MNISDKINFSATAGPGSFKVTATEGATEAQYVY